MGGQSLQRNTMIQLILAIAGIFYALRRSKLKALTAERFPNVPTEKVLEWQTLELKSANMFLWAAWGLFIISILIDCVLVALHSGRGTHLAVNGSILLLLFAFMHFSDVSARKAARIEKQFGIRMPK